MKQAIRQVIIGQKPPKNKRAGNDTLDNRQRVNAEMNTTSLEGSYETYQEENGANSPKNMGNDHLQSKYRHTKR